MLEGGGGGARACYVESREEGQEHLLATVREGDAVLLVGAGNSEGSDA